MDWIHCSACFVQPGADKSFYLTNCGHLFCNKCKESANGFCSSCKKPCTAILLTSKLKPEIQRYFDEPASIAKNLLQALEFQKRHRDDFTRYRLQQVQSLMATHQETLKQAKELERSYHENLKQMKEMERELHFVKEENAKLRAMLSRGEMNGSWNGRSTPGAVMVNTPSPRAGRHHSNSPSPALQKKQDMIPGRAHAGAGPPRLSIRTPPCNGRIGTVVGTPQRTTPTGRTPGSQQRMTISPIRTTPQGGQTLSTTPQNMQPQSNCFPISSVPTPLAAQQKTGHGSTPVFRLQTPLRTPLSMQRPGGVHYGAFNGMHKTS